jgi:hypothetical protein
MPISHIDFAIATSLFLLFVGILFSYIVSYFLNYSNIAKASELRGVAFDLFNTFFTGKGVPANWTEQSFTPVKVGLMNDLYMIAINVTETSGSPKDIVNGTVTFDSTCSKNILNSTVILYNSSNLQIPFQLWNQTFCADGVYLNSSDIVFNASLVANQQKFFFLYFSSERNVSAATYSVAFDNTSGYTFQTFPVKEMQMISVDRFKALRNLNYDEVVQTISKGYKFKVEVSS